MIRGKTLCAICLRPVCHAAIACHLSSDRALADFNRRFPPDEPCPYAATWLEALMCTANGSASERWSPYQSSAMYAITNSEQVSRSARMRRERGVRRDRATAPARVNEFETGFARIY